MSRTHKDARKYQPKERRISVRTVLRDPPDLRKLSRALIQLALAEAEAEAAAQNDVTTALPDVDDEAPDDRG